MKPTKGGDQPHGVALPKFSPEGEQMTGNEAALPTVKITKHDAERVKIWVSDPDAIHRLPKAVVGELFTKAWEAFKAEEEAANE